MQYWDSANLMFCIIISRWWSILNPIAYPIAYYMCFRFLKTHSKKSGWKRKLCMQFIIIMMRFYLDSWLYRYHYKYWNMSICSTSLILKDFEYVKLDKITFQMRPFCKLLQFVVGLIHFWVRLHGPYDLWNTNNVQLTYTLI